MAHSHFGSGDIMAACSLYSSLAHDKGTRTHGPKGRDTRPEANDTVAFPPRIEDLPLGAFVKSHHAA